MILNITPQARYVATAVSVPLEIKAILDGQNPITLLAAQIPGQYAFISPSSHIELNQSDAIIFPDRTDTISTDATPFAISNLNISGNNVTLDAEGNLVYNMQPATAGQLGGIKVGSNMTITADGILSTGDEVVLKNQPNRIAGQTEFIRPVKVANPANDTDAINLKTAQSMQAFDFMSRPLGQAFTDAGNITTHAFGSLLNPTATKAVSFVTDAKMGSNDAWIKYVLVLPLPPTLKVTNSLQSFLAMGYIDKNGYSSNPQPKLGEAICKGNYSNRTATVFPGWACPDEQPRFQSNCPAKSLTNPDLMGICIAPEDTAALVWVKPESFTTNSFKMERTGLAGLFSVNQNGVFTHLFNQSNSTIEGTGSNYGQVGAPGFVLGKFHSNSYWVTTPGLSNNAKVYSEYDPFGLIEQDFLIKQSHMFDLSRHDITSAAATVQSTWRVSGSLSPSTKYPSSNWLEVSVENNVVTITAQENTTGEARQGVANLLADLNGVTYTILINQEG